MPYDEPDETDPMVLMGVELPAGEESDQLSAEVFAEEFARMGCGEEEILALFRNPFYAGAHRAFRALGEARVRAIVSECAGVWGAVRVREVDPAPAWESGCKMVFLPIIECGKGERHG